MDEKKVEAQIDSLITWKNDTSKQIKDLQLDLKDLRTHLDNGWKKEFANEIYKMMLQTLNDYTDQIMNTTQQLVTKVVDGKIYQRNKKTIDVTKIFLLIFSGSGIIGWVLAFVGKLIK